MSHATASIVIPCFNAGWRIEACIRTCIEQSHATLQIVVVDNNSTDGSPERAKSLLEASGRDHVVTHCAVQGRCAARNHGFSHATGDYIQWLDADDELSPTKIAAQVDALERSPSFDIAYGDWVWKMFEDRVLRSEIPFSSAQYDDYLLQLLVDNWRPPHCFLLRRERAAQLHVEGAWSEERPAAADDRNYFTMAALLGARFLYVPEGSASYVHWSDAQATLKITTAVRSRALVRIRERAEALLERGAAGPLSDLHQWLLRQSRDAWVLAKGVAVTRSGGAAGLRLPSGEVIEASPADLAVFRGLKMRSMKESGAEEPLMLEHLAGVAVHCIGLMTRGAGELLPVPPSLAMPSPSAPPELLPECPSVSPLRGAERVVALRCLERFAELGVLVRDAR